MGGNLPYEFLPNFPLPNADPIVAPFAANIDTTVTGSVRYTNLTSDHYSDRDDVSSFINSQTNDYLFTGSDMMIVEWDAVPQYNSQTSVSGNVFAF